MSASRPRVSLLRAGNISTMKRELKFTLGIGIIVATVAFLVWTAVDQTKMYMITVAEYLDVGNSYAGNTLRITGKVAAGTMKWNDTTNDLRFTLTDMDGRGTIEVHYRGLLPDMFAEDKKVVVEGPYASASPFEATALLTTCPSKYEAKANS